MVQPGNIIIVCGRNAACTGLRCKTQV